MLRWWPTFEGYFSCWQPYFDAFQISDPLMDPLSWNNSCNCSRMVCLHQPVLHPAIWPLAQSRFFLMSVATAVAHVVPSQDYLWRLVYVWARQCRSLLPFASPWFWFSTVDPSLFMTLLFLLSSELGFLRLIDELHLRSLPNWTLTLLDTSPKCSFHSARTIFTKFRANSGQPHFWPFRSNHESRAPFLSNHRSFRCIQTKFYPFSCAFHPDFFSTPPCSLHVVSLKSPGPIRWSFFSFKVAQLPHRSS